MTAPTIPAPATSKRARAAKPAPCPDLPEAANDIGPWRYSPDKLRALMARAHGLRANLFVTTTGALVIQRGASSWHCSDHGAAEAVLSRLDSDR